MSDENAGHVEGEYVDDKVVEVEGEYVGQRPAKPKGSYVEGENPTDADADSYTDSELPESAREPKD